MRTDGAAGRRSNTEENISGAGVPKDPLGISGKYLGPGDTVTRTRKAIVEVLVSRNPILPGLSSQESQESYERFPPCKKKKEKNEGSIKSPVAPKSKYLYYKIPCKTSSYTGMRISQKV